MPRLPRVHDPGLLSLRRAARAAVVASGAFALGTLVLDDEVAGLYALFGSFAPLVFAHFGGPARSRAIAYAAASVGGGVLIVAGTALSGELLAATAGALAIGFALRFIGAFGGHVEAAWLPLILAYVLAATTEASFGDVDSRLIGWLGAGALVAPASVILWPHYERPRLLRAAGVACRALAAALRDSGRAGEAARAVEGFRSELARMPHRPAGPSEHDRALHRLSDQLIRLGGNLPAPVQGIDDERLATATATELEATAARLEGGRGRPDLVGLEGVRRAHRVAVAERAAAALREGTPPDRVLERLDASFAIRVASFGALTLAANALLLTKEALPPAEEFEVPPEVPEGAGVRNALRAALHELRAHLSRWSPRLQDALRGAAGVAIAIFVAIAASLPHAFWVVLGMLAVLRSNALGTERTAAEAILGVSAGFAVGAALMLALGTDTTVLWIAVPVTAFLAAYAPTAVHFVAGQAAFTVFVVVAFNIVDPIGWEVGLIRVEDVAIGAGVSLVVGVLLWPRGGRATLRMTAASAYRHGARYLSDRVALVLGGDERPSVEADRAELVGSTARLAEALRQHLGEPGTHLGIATWGPLLAGPRQMRAVGDALPHVYSYFGMPARPERAPRFAAAVELLTDRWRGFGDALDAGNPDGPHPDDADLPRDPAEATRGEVTAALEAWGGGADGRSRDAAMRLVWIRDWLRLLNGLADELPRPIAELAATASLPWWRR